MLLPLRFFSPPCEQAQMSQLEDERLHGGESNCFIQGDLGPAYSLPRKAELPTYSWPEMHGAHQENCPADSRAINLTL